MTTSLSTKNPPGLGLCISKPQSEDNVLRGQSILESKTEERVDAHFVNSSRERPVDYWL